jgi:subtilase family serine protease
MQLRNMLLSTLIASALSFSPAWSQSQRHSIIAKHVPYLVSSGRAAVVGPVDPSTSMRLYLSLPLQNEAALNELLVELQDQNDPLYHKYLSPDEFTRRFGPSVDDYAVVVAWARDKGFVVGATPPNRRFVDITGTVATINNAFQISLTTYLDQTHNRHFFAPNQEPTVSLPVQLLAVSGLDNATPPKSNLVTGSEVGQPVTKMSLQGPSSSNNGSGQGGSFVPSDMRAAYYGTGPLNGAGQTVAIFSYAGYSPSDLQLYYQDLHMSTSVPVNVVAVNGFNSNCGSSCSDAEQLLDIANVIGMAPGLSQVLFYEGSSSTSVLNQMATDDKASVISNSWYNGDFGAASDPIFKQFQSQGQTFVSASGDYGDYNNTGLGGWVWSS